MQVHIVYVCPDIISPSALWSLPLPINTFGSGLHCIERKERERERMDVKDRPVFCTLSVGCIVDVE